MAAESPCEQFLKTMKRFTQVIMNNDQSAVCAFTIAAYIFLGAAGVGIFLCMPVVAPGGWHGYETLLRLSDAVSYSFDYTPGVGEAISLNETNSTMIFDDPMPFIVYLVEVLDEGKIWIDPSPTDFRDAIWRPSLAPIPDGNFVDFQTQRFSNRNDSRWGIGHGTTFLEDFSTSGRGFAFRLGNEVSPIPVPAAVWLFGSAMLGLMGVAKRRKA